MDLQKFDHRSSGYDRPDDWVCGRAADGKPCRLGPDASGRCQTTHECVPSKTGERWKCTRPPALGGPCAGPMPDGTCSRPVVPCAPVATRKRRQRAVAKWMLLVALGIVLLLFGTWQTQMWISPGPLTHAHAEIDSCGECHEGYRRGPVGWLALAFGDVGDPSPHCVKCHYRTDHPFQPHSYDPVLLARLTEGKQPDEGPIHLALAARLTESDPPIRCTSCHQEHRGRDAALTSIADGTCQSCHVARFTSFTSGHPDFDDYPYVRRTHIVFDHRAHLEKHFDEEGRRERAPVGCVGCHVVEPSGEKMLVASFEETCAACHQGQVDGDDRPAGTRGIAVLTAPGLDLWTLEERGYDVGNWPRLSERPITPFMELVLSRDPSIAADLERLRGADLLDLEDAGPDILVAATRLARAIKIFYWELERHGPEVMTRRLGENLDERDMPALLASLPRSAVRSANETWFPGLEDDVRRFRAGAPLRVNRTVRAPEQQAVSPSPVPATGDDDLLGGGDDLLASGDDDLLATDDDLLGDESDDLLAGDDDLLAGGDDLLAGSDDDLLGDDDLLAGDDDLLTGSDDVTSDAGPTGVANGDAPEQDPPLGEEEWARLGGWFRDQEALFYRPVGHPDRFLYAWLTIAPRYQEESAAVEIFRDLSQNKPPGACTKCHSVDAVGTTRVVRWTPTDAANTKRGFTAFAHAPHFSLMGNRGCVSCHRISSEANYLASYEQEDPDQFAAGFDSIEISLCERCHTARTTTHDCTLCHNYHVGISRQPPRL